MQSPWSGSFPVDTPDAETPISGEISCGDSIAQASTRFALCGGVVTADCDPPGLPAITEVPLDPHAHARLHTAATANTVPEPAIDRETTELCCSTVFIIQWEPMSTVQ